MKVLCCSEICIVCYTYRCLNAYQQEQNTHTPSEKEEEYEKKKKIKNELRATIFIYVVNFCFGMHSAN